MAIEFSTEILQAEGMKATGIPVPESVIEQLGSKRPAVTLTIGDYSYRTTIGRMGSTFMAPLSAEHRAASGLAAGDLIEVSIELDTAPRTVEAPPTSLLHWMPLAPARPSRPLHPLARRLTSLLSSRRRRRRPGIAASPPSRPSSHPRSRTAPVNGHVASRDTNGERIVLAARLAGFAGRRRLSRIA